jgi:hypothetical protein
MPLQFKSGIVLLFYTACHEPSIEAQARAQPNGVRTGPSAFEGLIDKTGRANRDRGSKPEEM